MHLRDHRRRYSQMAPTVEKRLCRLSVQAVHRLLSCMLIGALFLVSSPRLSTTTCAIYTLAES